MGNISNNSLLHYFPNCISLTFSSHIPLSKWQINMSSLKSTHEKLISYALFLACMVESSYRRTFHGCLSHPGQRVPSWRRTRASPLGRQVPSTWQWHHGNTPSHYCGAILPLLTLTDAVHKQSGLVNRFVGRRIFQNRSPCQPPWGLFIQRAGTTAPKPPHMLLCWVQSETFKP